MNASGGIDWAQKRYDRIQEMDRNGRLRCDTVRYTCGQTPVVGTFVFCYAGQDLVRAVHDRLEGDHAYLVERYFYDDGELYFTHLTQGAWQFGAPVTREDGSESSSGTVDEVYEERRYFENGNLIDRMYKDYTLKSWIDTIRPDQIPNARSGRGVEAVIGSDDILSVASSASYTCD